MPAFNSQRISEITLIFCEKLYPAKAGRYGVFHEEKLIGVFDNSTSAVDFGIAHYKKGDFVVQQIIDYSKVPNYLYAVGGRYV
jgi:hypothetical protein